MTRVLRIAVAAVLLACPAGRGARRREFDGERAFGFLQQQLAFGPRIPGTPGHERAGDWILTHQGIAFNRKGEFLAHWDTRPHADQSANLGAQRLPVPGANDGASGVAVLLGVAGALKVKPPAVGVDLLFVDGEDYGDFADSSDVLIGSRYFAAHQPAGYPPLYAVLFDMVGDKSLDIYYEGNSQTAAPEVVDRVWRTAHDLGYDRYFLPGTKHTLVDDHVPLQRAGIHAIDVVDFDYPFWHTTEDTIDKVSAASLQIVGDVAVALVR